MRQESLFKIQSKCSSNGQPSLHANPKQIQLAMVNPIHVQFNKEEFKIYQSNLD